MTTDSLSETLWIVDSVDVERLSLDAFDLLPSDNF